MMAPKKTLICSSVAACLLLSMQSLQATAVKAAPQALYPDTRISLLLAGSERSRLGKYLRTLEEVSALPGVQPGVVYLHGISRRTWRTPNVRLPGPDNGAQLSRLEIGVLTFGPAYRELYALGLRSHRTVLTSEVFSSITPRYSPTWVIRWRGKDFIYEGLERPQRLFSRSGEFLPGSRLH